MIAPQLEHSPWAYRTDFALYALASLLMASYLVLAGPHDRRDTLWLPAVMGLICWPALEYALHRFVLHGLKPFSTWHAEHHRRPRALICTPTLLSAGLIALLVFAPSAILGDRWLALSLTFGLLTGYLAYAITHHAIHHWHGNNAWLKQRQLSHALHHDPKRPQGHYGVLSSLWDEVMGTDHRHHSRHRD